MIEYAPLALMGLKMAIDALKGDPADKAYKRHQQAFRETERDVDQYRGEVEQRRKHELGKALGLAEPLNQYLGDISGGAYQFDLDPFKAPPPSPGPQPPMGGRTGPGTYRMTNAGQTPGPVYGPHGQAVGPAKPGSPGADRYREALFRARGY